MADRKVHRRPYTPPNVDGFRDDEEELVAYCPREKRKKPLKEHEGCEHHRGNEKTKEGGPEVVECDYEDKEPDAKKKKKQQKKKKRSKE